MSITSSTVFIVDDQLTIQKMLSDILGCLGYNTITASDGFEAVQMYTEMREQIGVILLDVIMPGMNGMRTLEKLKQINPDVKIIMCSAYITPDKLPELNESDICGFINKPYTITTLSRFMEEVLSS